MMKHSNSFTFTAVFSIICWVTIITQAIVMLQNSLVSSTETLIRFFTFFTILSNILVAVTLSCTAWQPKNSMAFFLKPTTQTAVAVYIFVVGFVYNSILRFLWEPKGLQRIVDEMLHLIIPIVYIVYWFYKVNKLEITWKNILSWLAFPVVYLIVVMLRGSFSNYYPYPFVNVTELGIVKVTLNTIYMTMLFGLVSIVFVGIAKYKSRK